jgi:hypothetical protein
MAYATVTEFLRLLQVSQPSAAQTTAAQRCLDAATQEIDSYLSRNVGTVAPPAFGTAELALVTQVNLDRASEHWRLTPYGAMNQGPDMGAVFVRIDSFERHRAALSSLKTDWGVG